MIFWVLTCILKSTKKLFLYIYFKKSNFSLLKHVLLWIFFSSITCICSYICISHSQCLNTIQLQTIMHSFEEFWKSSYSLWLLSTQNNCLFVFSIHRCSSHFYYSLGHCTSFIGECLVSIEKFFGIKSKYTYMYIIFKMSG